MTIERCNRDMMLEHWNQKSFTFAAMQQLGESDACIDGFIGEQMMALLRIPDQFGNKISQPHTRLFELYSQLIPDLTTARFDSIIDKMLAHGFIEEQNGVCHWRKEPMVAMPLS